MPLASGEILVLTDARQSLAPDAVRRLVAYFADPTVGAVSGELHLLPSPGSPVEGVGLYWKYEKLIRKAESRFDSTVGVTGAFYALRKELFLPIDPRTILDDVAIPMRVALAGRRVLFAPEARAWDHVEESAARVAGNDFDMITGVEFTSATTASGSLLWSGGFHGGGHH